MQERERANDDIENKIVPKNIHTASIVHREGATCIGSSIATLLSGRSSIDSCLITMFIPFTLTKSALSTSACLRLVPARGDRFGGVVVREAGFGESVFARPSTRVSSLDFGGVIIPTSGVPCRLPLAESFNSRLLEIS